jgi:hypothetical protein
LIAGLLSLRCRQLWQATVQQIRDNKMDERRGPKKYDPPSGLVQSASATPIDKKNFAIQLKDSSAQRGKARPLSIAASYPLIDSSGLFIGALPGKNTPIIVEEELGGKYHFVSYEPEKTAIIPNLVPGQLLIQSNDSSKISLDLNNHIFVGSNIHRLHIWAGSSQTIRTNLLTTTFDEVNHFTQGYREMGGTVKRDIFPNPIAASASGNTKLEDDSYEVNQMREIGLDPSARSNSVQSGPIKNPPFVEHREMVYEFQYKSNVSDDETEANRYSNSASVTTTYTTANRRGSRADTMSLTLKSPNFLMESIKGTVVDVYGNVLDINRVPLPVGLKADTTLRTQGQSAVTDPKTSYINIRALERKSIAYHFEVNARKDPKPKNQGSDLSIDDDNYNAKLQRSRFFFDIDKEGQFKLNVPASSETGNVPLLVRPENYSTFGKTDPGTSNKGNPNQTWFLPSGQPISQDIFVDSFAAPQKSPSGGFAGFDTQFPHGSIKILDGATNADAGPTDRITQFVDNSPTNIRHGTAYHDILSTCSLHQNNDTIQAWQLGTAEIPVDTTYITALQDLVKTTITVSGTGANAGGRSGQINMDGSLEMNIGSNTVDRQSLWLDTAGGIIANIGRDRNLRSAMVNFDGDVIMQIGGFGPATEDARFSGNTIPENGTLDLRVFNGGYAHMFRIDKFGITIISPSSINIYSAQDIKINSDADLSIEAETLLLNGRMVLKAGPSI